MRSRHRRVKKKKKKGDVPPPLQLAKTPNIRTWQAKRGKRKDEGTSPHFDCGGKGKTEGVRGFFVFNSRVCPDEKKRKNLFSVCRGQGIERGRHQRSSKKGKRGRYYHYLLYFFRDGRNNRGGLTDRSVLINSRWAKDALITPR